MGALLAVLWLGCGIGSAMVAENKGRNGPGWFAAGLLLGPLALLIVSFMAPGTRAVKFSPSTETVLYSEGKVRVTNQRLLVKNNTFVIGDLQPVVVSTRGPNSWEIKLCNLSGEKIFTLTSDNEDRMERISRAINDAITAHASATDISQEPARRRAD